MYYRICDNIALRKWKFVPHAYYIKEAIEAQSLSDEEFEALLLCDGEHDLPPSDILEVLKNKGLAEECGKGDVPGEWSRFREYPHRYFPKMNLMITGKCNYNCIHCFNAADNTPLMSEWKYEDALDLIKQAEECGIHSFTITGGEPMLYPHFMDIIREIYRRNMTVFEINTNGYFISQEKLDMLKAIGCNAKIKISFDGIGYHDWMRNRKGAEERTLAAMKLCIENGFTVMSQTNVNRVNYDSLEKTLDMLDEMGVECTRIIRTTEAARWQQAAGDACMTFPEYYEKMTELVSDYSKRKHRMKLVIWQFMEFDPNDESYRMVPIKYCEGQFRPTYPVCSDNRKMIAVSSNGNVYPCLQMSGSFMEAGLELDSLKNRTLAEILSGGQLHDAICTNLHKLAKENPVCKECRYFKYCAGGCRAIGIICSVEKFEPGSILNYYGEDKAKCLFFRGGWYKKLSEAMKGFNNLSRVEYLENDTASVSDTEE